MEFNKRAKQRWSGRSLIKWLEDSNTKYKQLSVKRPIQREREGCFSLDLILV